MITTDSELIQKAVDTHGRYIFNAEEWLNNPYNIAMAKNGSIGLFEYFSEGVYTGHYFYLVRGKEAKKLALDMLEEAFGKFAKAIRGLTPLQNRAARWMSRQIGFKSYGVIHDPSGPCELFILTKDDFSQRKSNGQNRPDSLWRQQAEE